MSRELYKRWHQATREVVMYRKWLIEAEPLAVDPVFESWAIMLAHAARVVVVSRHIYAQSLK